MKPSPEAARRLPVALAIAGSDSGGGAGIQADLKTFAAMGVHGASAIVALTAQNTLSVSGIEEVSVAMVRKQIDAVATDLGVDAAKTGMLFSSRIISEVAREVKRYGFPLVVDPVMVSKGGARLLKEDAMESLARELIPLASVVTPNGPEAGRLTGVRVRSLEDSKLAAKRLVRKLGATAAVVKGGHLRGKESIDVLFWEGRTWELRAPRLESRNTHGTGCVFSAAIAAELAKGSDIRQSVQRAKLFVSCSIEYGLPLGKGHGPVNPIAWLALPAEREMVLESIRQGVELLEAAPEVSRLTPEVQMNLVMALPAFYAKGTREVAGIPGRIVKVGERVKATSPPAFGASSHLARVLLAAMRFDPSMRAAANVGYSREAVSAARRAGLRVSFYDRRKEPRRLRAVEGATLPWVVERAILAAGRVPDVVYDLGDRGKEPMVRVLGKDAVDVAGKVLSMARGTRGN